MNFPNDGDLQSIFDATRTGPEVARIQAVRRRILLAAVAKPRRAWMAIIGLEPALLVATGIFGLALGMAFPLPVDGEAQSVSWLDLQPDTALDAGAG